MTFSPAQFEVDEVCRHCGHPNPDKTLPADCPNCGQPFFHPPAPRPIQPISTSTKAYFCFCVPLTISLCILIVQLINNLNTRNDLLGDVLLTLQIFALPFAVLWPWIGLLIWRTAYQPKRRDTQKREPMGRAAATCFFFSLFAIPLAILVIFISAVFGSLSLWSVNYPVPEFQLNRVV